MKLYSLTFSPNGRKAESLIGYLGIDAEIHQVDMQAGEHKSEAFLAMNPNGKIPVLEDDGFVVWESNAIVTYLATKYPEKNLLPTGLQERSMVDRWLSWGAVHFGGAVYTMISEKVLKPMFGGQTDPARVEEAMRDLARFCAVLDKQLAGKEYVCGALSLADFGIGTWAESAPALGFSYADYPNVAAWVERVTALPGWVQPPRLG